MDRRAVSTALGTVFLVLIVLLATAALHASGGIPSPSSTGANLEAAEHELASFGGAAQGVADGTTTNKEVDLSLESNKNEAVIHSKPQAGTVRITVGGTQIFQDQLGAVIYDQDGRTIGYQGGGVWRINRDGGATVVNHPGWARQTLGDGDPTISTPIILVRGKDTLSGSAVIRSESQETLYNDREVASGETVKVTIQSQFYEAWARYLTESVGFAESAVTVDDSLNSVTLEYGAGQHFFYHAGVSTIHVEGT